MAECSATELMEEGKCFQCLSQKELQMVIAQLLCNLSDSTETNPLNKVFSGVGNPTGVVTPTALEAIYFDTSTGVQYNWYSATWH